MLKNLNVTKRLKRVIEREKIKYPNTAAVYLLIHRFAQIQLKNYKNFKMILAKDSTFTANSEMSMCSLFPKNVLDIVIEELKPTSVLDVGCGVGKSLEYFSNLDIDTIGIENSPIAISKSSVKEKIIKYNLKHQFNLNRSFDLVWCFEVIEHIHPDYEKAFLHNLIRHSNKILISAAQPGQGGHGHFNEQEPEYWVQKFKKLGYSYNEKFSAKVKATKDNHSENLMFFEKS